MNISEKVAYIKGLAEGLNVEDKVIKAILDVLADIAKEVNELKEDAEYEVFLKGESIGKVKTNLSGKLNLSIDLKTEDVDVKIVEA